MDQAGVFLAVGAVLAIWVIICYAVGKAAKAKGRSATTWGFLTFIPLGPILAPLWLASMPHVGGEASWKQLTGRTVLCIWLVVSLALRVGLDAVNKNIEDQAMVKADADYGFQTELVTTHYKKMLVDEIVECITLSQTSDAMQYDADYDAANATYYFETQDQADTYNNLIAQYKDMECQERTYDVADLDRAMKIIEGGP